jgi:hypothetical protein
MTDGVAPSPRRKRHRLRLNLLTMMAIVLTIGAGLGWLARSRRVERERQMIRAEIALAKAELKRAQDRVTWSDRLHQKGYVSKAQNVADRLALQQKVFALAQAEAKQSLFVKSFGR